MPCVSSSVVAGCVVLFCASWYVMLSFGGVILFAEGGLRFFGLCERGFGELVDIGERRLGAF